MEFCDGFVFQGGLISCNYEIEIAKRALELNKPMIGVCAGFNNILRALGSKVELDKTSSHDIYDINYRHKVMIEKNTIIYDILGKDVYMVNSIHSMVAKRDELKDFVKISSYSEDGLIESYEVPNKKFVVGIKWHPELMDEDFANKLFKKFIESCMKWNIFLYYFFNNTIINKFLIKTTIFIYWINKTLIIRIYRLIRQISRNVSKWFILRIT